MSHDSHSGHSTENKAVISFGNGFWLVIIIVGLFIAALNFVQAESVPEGHGGHSEATHEAHHDEAGSHSSLKAAHQAETPPSTENVKESAKKSEEAGH